MKATATKLIFGLVLVAAWATQAHATYPDGWATMKIVSTVTTGAFFVLAAVGLAVDFILRQRYQRDVHLAAIEKGMAVPELPKKRPLDLRKPALILLALGVGYTIAMFVTVSLTDNARVSAMAVAIWGIVPVLIGLALLKYRKLAERDRLLAAEE